MDDRRLKEKLSGRVRYPRDVSSKNLLFVRMLFSAEERADLAGFLLPELPEGVSFFSSPQIPGRNWIDFGDGGMPLLAEKEIRYRGEPLGFLCGPDPDELNALIREVEVQYVPKEAGKVLDIRSTDNIAYEREIRKGEAEEMFRRSEVIVLEDFFQSGEQYHFSSIHPSCSCQKEGNRYIVHTISQWPWMVQKNILSLLKLKKDQVQIKPYSHENSQDSALFTPVQMAAVTALACFLTKRPVSLMVTQGEGFFLSRGRGLFQAYLKAAVNKQGDLLALKADFSLDCGAWPLWPKEWVDRICFSITGAYHCRNIEIHGKGHRLNLPPSGQFPDGNISPAFTAMELLASRLIALNAQDPLDWRRKNILRRGNGFFTGSLLRREPYLDELIRLVVEASDFSRKYSAYQYQSARVRPEGDLMENRGIGISLAYMPTGFTRVNQEFYGTGINMRLDQDGQLTIQLPFLPGQKQLFKYWSHMASKTLNLEESQIQFQFPPNPISTGPSTLGRSVTSLNQSIQNGLQWINKRRFRDPLPLETSRRSRAHSEKWEDESFEGLPYPAFSWGAMVVELSHVPETSEVRIKHVWTALDAGQRMLPALSDTMVERGLRQAQCWIMEECPSAVRYPGFHERIPFTALWKESQNQPKNLDGLVQNLFPAAYLQALSQAVTESQHQLPGITFREGGS